MNDLLQDYQAIFLAVFALIQAATAAWLKATFVSRSAHEKSVSEAKQRHDDSVAHTQQRLDDLEVVIRKHGHDTKDALTGVLTQIQTDMHNLSLSIAEIQGDLKGMKAESKGTEQAHKRLEDQLNRMDEFLRKMP